MSDDFRLTVDGRPVGGTRPEARHARNGGDHDHDDLDAGHGDEGPRWCSDAEVRQLDHRPHRERHQEFSEGEAAQRGVRILRDGQPLAFSDLNTGDHLTATIVTTHPPKIMTSRQVSASMASAPSAGLPPAPTASTPTRMAAATPVAAPGAPDAPREHHQLPKTASALPLIALVGAAATLLGLTLTALRRRRTA